jgi:hypothetical protein
MATYIPCLVNKVTITFACIKTVNMNQGFIERISTELKEIESAGLFKKERVITSEQGAEITVNGKKVLNFCANNYLGLSSHPKVIEAAHKAIDYTWLWDEQCAFYLRHAGYSQRARKKAC